MERLREHYFSMTCGLSAFLGTGVGGGPSQPRDSASLGTEGSGVGNLPEPRLEDPCPFVELMMHRLFGGDRELIDWIQRLFGLYLSGEKYSKMVCLYGGGGNGKSVLSRLLGKVLGGMSHLDCPKALLFDVADKGGRSGDFSHRQDMLTRAANDLESKRLLVCDEVGKGLCLNEEKFKQITGGGDTMSARKLYHESRTIDTSSAKILTLANPPFFEVPSSSFAFKRRVAVIEVKARFSHDSSEVDHVNVHACVWVESVGRLISYVRVRLESFVRLISYDRAIGRGRVASIRHRDERRRGNKHTSRHRWRLASIAIACLIPSWAVVVAPPLLAPPPPLALRL